MSGLVVEPVALFRHRHTLRQMGALALSGLAHRSARSAHLVRQLKATVIEGRLPAVSRREVHQFLRVTQGESLSADSVPPTFYVTWALAAVAQSVRKLQLPYNFARALHAGGSVSYERPLRFDEPACFATEVSAVDDNERRAKVTVTSTVTDEKQAVIFKNSMSLYVPKATRTESRASGNKEHQYLVNKKFQPLAVFHLAADLGARYARVSGDYNPLHWSRLAARGMGFKTLFAQGYCLKALIAHAFIDHLLHGQSEAFRELGLEFRRPVFLPQTVTLFVSPPQGAGETRERHFALSATPRGEALITGHFTHRTPS